MGIINWLRGEWGGGKIDRDIAYWQKREIVTTRGMTHTPKRGWRDVPNTDMNMQRGKSGWFQFFVKETHGAAANSRDSGYQGEIVSAESTQTTRSPWFYYERDGYVTHDTRNNPRTLDNIHDHIGHQHSLPDPGPASYPTGEPVVESWPGGADPRGEPPAGYSSW